MLIHIKHIYFRLTVLGFMKLLHSYWSDKQNGCRKV